MNALITGLLSSPWAQRAGWVLVHSLWQGTIVAILLGFTLRLLRDRSSQSRWLAACIGLAAMAIAPAVTAFLVQVPPRAAVQSHSHGDATAIAQVPVSFVAPGATMAAGESVAMPPMYVAGPMPDSPARTISDGQSTFGRISEGVRPMMPWLLLGWLVGVSGMSFWHLGGWILLQWTRRRHTGPVSPGVRRIFQSLLQRLHMSRPVQLLESASVAVPVVIGWLRPVILLPASTIYGLTPDQLEAVLAHELSHIRRFDYLVGLFQAVIETLFFYHPAVWWISRRIRQESEYCCDELALKACPDRQNYAQALLRIVELGAQQPHLAVAASGGKVLSRIRRILGLPVSENGASARWLAGMLVLALLAGASVILHCRIAGAENEGGDAPFRKAVLPPGGPAAGAARPANPPSTNATRRANELKVNLKSFSLVLAYQGQADKPYYGLRLSVPALNKPEIDRAFDLRVQISEEQAAKIIDHLAIEEFFDRAFSLTDWQFIPKATEPGYTLTIGNLYADLGWELPMLARLDGLRRVLDGDAAKSMDLLLGRLSGHRKEWEKPAAARSTPLRPPQWGESKDGLRTRLWAAKQAFRAGEAIALKLEIENIGKEAKSYRRPPVPTNGDLIVLDDKGRKVPYLGGLAQVQVPLLSLDPGKSSELKSFDLAEWYYLRRPGRYSVRWPDHSPGQFIIAPPDANSTPEAAIPGTAALEFEVIADSAAAADGDPIGRLLPLVKDQWWLGAPGKPGPVHPGRNRAAVIGRFITIQYNPTGLKTDAGLVWLWLTDEAAADQAASADSPPSSEYLGKIARWHAYVHVDRNAARAWPAAKEDIRRALAAEPPATWPAAGTAPEWSEPLGGLSTRLALNAPSFKAGDPIAIHLEVRNTGDKANVFQRPTEPSNSTLIVRDEQGRDVTYLGAPVQAMVRGITIDAHQDVALDSFDLAQWYYLRRPGRYTVSWPGTKFLLRGTGSSALPATREIQFEVAANPGATVDGDPIGRLLPLVKQGWEFEARRILPGKARPVGDRPEVTGWSFAFVYSSPNEKSPRISLWLTDQPAAEEPAAASESPAREYLGKVSRWHVYVHIPASGIKAWPAAKEDIKRALALPDFQAIKPGMRRADIEKAFPMDGGLQGISSVRFVHPDCPNLMVNVEFEFKRDPADQNRAVSSSDDKVTKVSEPYVALPHID